MMRFSATIRGLLVGGLAVTLAGCNSTTSKLSPATEQQFAAEGVTRRADDLTFRYTHDAGTRESGW